MKKKTTGLLLGTLLIFSTCKKPEDSPAYLALQKDLENARIKVAKMENSSEWRLKKALEYKRNGNKEQALKTLELILIKEPTSVLSHIVQREIYDLKARDLMTVKKVDQAIQSRFLKLPEQKKVILDSLTLSLRKLEVRERWTHDKYGSKAHFTKAGKGNRFIIPQILIRSKSNNPKLPALSIYRLDNRKLIFVKALKYKFNRWGNYNFYLGNEVDPQNDFAQKKSIKFLPAVLLTNELIQEETLFLVAKKKTCIVRKENRFNNPPVEYIDMFCTYPKELTAEEFKANFSLLKILKKGK